MLSTVWRKSQLPRKAVGDGQVVNSHQVRGQKVARELEASSSGSSRGDSPTVGPP
jgi:hypothetical protein